MNKLKEVLTNNIGYKFISIVIAILVWLLIVNIDDPLLSRNFTSNVEVTHAELLTAQGKYYTILDDNNTVTFRVTAKRSVIERLTSSDFHAVADMALLEDDRRVPIEIEVLNHANAVSLSTRLHYLDVVIGREMSSNFVVEAEENGTPADGCIVDEIELSPNVLTVVGPEEIVSTIERVKAVCDVTDQNADFSESIVPVLVDANGNEIDTTRLRLSEDTVRASVRMTNIKTVPIRLETMNEPGEGVELSDVQIRPSTIEIKGHRSILNTISEIMIPAEVMDISQVTDDLSTTVDITSYLPTGVTLADATQTQVEISVKIHPESTKTLTLSSNHISIENIGDGLQASFDQNSVSVSVSALPSVLSELDSQSLTGSVNLTGLGVGSHTVRVDVDQNDKYTVGPVTIKVTISAM